MPSRPGARSRALVKASARSRAPVRTKARSRAPVKAKPRKPPASRTARAKRKGTPRPVQPYRTYTPALIANLQHRYEWTPEPVVTIAADAGIHPTSLHRMAKSRGWQRHNLLPPRDLPAALKSFEATRALDARPGTAAEAMHDAVPSHNDLAAVERLEQGVLKELATVEAMRASLSGEPQRPIDAERTARTLSLLTQTLQHLQRMRAGQMLAAQPTATDHHHDHDIPADIDAFRLDLARRIDAFVQSELDAQDVDARSGPAPVA